MMKVTKQLSVFSAVLFCSLFIFATVQNVLAQVPRQFNYQGLIQSSNGQPISDGDHSVTVSLYANDIGGVALYSETQVVKIERGIFSVQVGSKTPIPFAFKFDGPLFLALSVDGSSELSPRTPIVAVPYSLHSEVAEFARGLASDARGVVTSINEIDGPLNIIGDSTISVKQTGKVISLHAYPNIVSQGLAGIQPIDKSVTIQNGNGPFAGVGVADSGITTTKLADGSVTPLKLNQAGATFGQILKWNGVRWIPSNDSGSVYTAGNGVSIVSNTISVTHPLPVGTTLNSTLHWDGLNWVENQNFTSAQSGQTFINNDLTLTNGGAASSLRLSEPAASGNNFTAFKATTQAADITYTLPASLPATSGYLAVDNTGALTWSAAVGLVSFDQITAGVNLGQLLTIGAGSNLSPIGSGIITANRFVSVGSTSNAVDLATAEVAGILPVSNGGTNSGTALNNNRLMYSNGGAIMEFATGNNGQVLMSTGSSTPPSWSNASIIPNGTANNSTLRWNLATSQWQENINILSSASGQLTVSNGIDLSGAANPILANGSAGTIGQALLSNGPGNTPTWTSINTLPTGTVTSSTLRWNGTAWVENTNVLSSATGLVTVNAGINLNGTASPIQLNGLTGTTGQVLTTGGPGVTPTWTTINTLPTGTLNNSTLRWNGTAWVENTNVLTTTAGLVTANAGVDLNGTTSPLQLNGATGTTGQVLTSAGVGVTPTWTTINTLPTGTGTDNTLRWNGTSWVETALVKSSSTGLVTANGGLNLNGTTSTMQLNGVTGTSGQVLTSAGVGLTPTWTTINTLSAGTANDNTLRWNGTSWIETALVKSSATGLVTANGGVNLNGTTAALQLNGVTGTTGQVLTSAGSGATPTWTTINTLPTGTLTNSTLRWNGTTWVENTNVLTSTAGLVTANAGVNLNGATSPLQLNGANGTTGQVLTSAGANTPTWTTINTLPTGTGTDNTLRWNGTSWVETALVKSSATGLVTANGGVNLNGTTAPMQLNGVPGASGQFLTSAGAGNTPTWTTLAAGTNITLTNAAGTVTIAATGGIGNGTLTNSTLHWNGTSWVENTNVLTNNAGLITTNGGVNLNGASSPMQLNGIAGTSGQFLTSAGAGATPTWTTINTLPTGTLTNSTLHWNGTNWIENTNVLTSATGLVTANGGVNLNGATSTMQLNGLTGTSGQVLTSAGAGATPTWTTLATLTAGTSTDNTLRWSGTAWVETANITSTTAGLLKANAGVNLNGTTSPLQLNGLAGTSGQFLTSAGGATTPTWTTLLTLPTGTTNDNTLRWNGTAWVETALVKSSATGLVTANGGVNLGGTTAAMQLNGLSGTSGQVFTSAGAGATPTWTTLATLTAGTANDNTLRWNGTAWVETALVKSSATGLVTATGGVNLGGTTAPMQLNGLAGASGQVLTSAGAGSTPTWTTLATLTAGTANDNTLRWNGTAWVETALVKSSATGLVTANGGVNLNTTSSPLSLNGSAGTTGQFLTSAGTGVTPTWTTGNLLSNGTATDNTLRWNGTTWVETSNVTSTAAGLVKVNAGVNLNGASSPLQLNGANGTTGQILTSAGAATPTWTTLAAGTNITLTTLAGTLTIASTGGIGNGTAVDNTLRWNGTAWVETSVVKSNSSGLFVTAQISVDGGLKLNSTASPLILNNTAGTSGQFLTSAGAGATPTWTTGNLLSNGTATDNTLRWNGTTWVETANVTSTAAGLVKVNAGLQLNSTASPLILNTSAGTSGQFLTSAGTGATPTWTTGSLLPNGTATDNTLRWNGTAWVETSVVKSNSSGLFVTAQISVDGGLKLNSTSSPLILNTLAGNTGQFLTSAGAGATPTWTTGSLLPNGSAANSTLYWNGSAWLENTNVLSTAAGQLTVNNGIVLNNTASPLILNNTAGNSGQFLVSQGAGATPQWQTINTLPTGLGINSTLRWSGSAWVENTNVQTTAAGVVTAYAGLTLIGTTSPLTLNSQPGISGQFLKSQGPGNTPVWATGTLVPAATADNNTLRWNAGAWVESSLVTSTATGILGITGGLDLNGLNTQLKLNGFAGNTGQVLTSAGLGATPTWTTINSIANGTAPDNTLRWDNSALAWVETPFVTSSATGTLAVTGAFKLNGLTTPMNVRTSDGNLNDVLISKGVGASPQWVDPNTLISGWKLAGNTATTPGTGGGQNYMGTTDNKDVVFASNGFEHFRIMSTTATTATTPFGVLYGRAVLPGGGSGIYTGMTIETVLPSSASAPSTPSGAFGGLFSSSTITNGVSLGASSIYCAFNSTVTINGSANTNTIRANDGIVVVDNSTSGITHSTLVGSYGSIRTNSTSNSTTITDGAAIRSNFVLNSTSSVITNADGLLIENPTLGGGVPNTAITTYNGVRVQNLSAGTTKRAFLYDGTGSNVPVAITSAGQIGIGRKDPTQALEVYNGNILISNNTNTAGLLELTEPSGSGSNFTALRARAQAADITYDLPSTQPATNQVLTATAISGAGPYTVTLDWQNGGASSGWSLTGNAATTPGTNYLGTTDNQAFEIHVFETDGVNKGSKRVMRYEPNATSANIIGGYSGNTITSGVGSVIAGGGNSGNQNSIGDNYGFVGGGAKNTAGNSGGGKTFATVGGGFSNIASGQYAVVGGGNANSATGTSNVVLGGDGNVSNGSSYASVFGGHQNLSSAVGATVVGGEIDTASGQYSFVGAGQHNVAASQYSVVSGGSSNTITSTGDYSVIPGGQQLKLGSNSFGVNMTAASDVTGQANIAYFGNMNLWIGNTNSTSRELRFYGSNGSATYAGAHYSAFKAGAQTADITYTLPTAQPTDVGQVLGVNTAGASPVLEWTGSSRGTVTSQNAAYTALSTDRFVFVTNAGAGYNLTLPTAANKGQMITVTKTDNNANTITIVAAAGQAIVQVGTPGTLGAQGKSVTLVADGTTTWYVVGHE